ncbi:hypothetical protein OFB62_28855, partial [Escherichia coli]|nr:hypothetical protein [Escherichia coli]
CNFPDTPGRLAINLILFFKQSGNPVAISGRKPSGKIRVPGTVGTFRDEYYVTSGLAGKSSILQCLMRLNHIYVVRKTAAAYDYILSFFFYM